MKVLTDGWLVEGLIWEEPLVHTGESRKFIVKGGIGKHARPKTIPGIQYIRVGEDPGLLRLTGKCREIDIGRQDLFGFVVHRVYKATGDRELQIAQTGYITGDRPFLLFRERYKLPVPSPLCGITGYGKKREDLTVNSIRGCW
jgi:hypothetical protein